jgi:hypothetical protein
MIESKTWTLVQEPIRETILRAICVVVRHKGG